MPTLKSSHLAYLLASLFTLAFNWLPICSVQHSTKGNGNVKMSVFFYSLKIRQNGWKLMNRFSIWLFPNRELSDTIMNVVGAFMWVSVGATALHYWQGYMADHDQLVVVHERTVSGKIEKLFFFGKMEIKCFHRFVEIKFSGWIGAWFAMCSGRSFVCSRHRSGIHPFCKINDNFKKFKCIQIQPYARVRMSGISFSYLIRMTKI